MAEKHVRFLWRWILMPLLFCLIGTIINFQQLPGSTIVKAVGLIFAGACLRRMVCRIENGPDASYVIAKCAASSSRGPPQDRRSAMTLCSAGIAAVDRPTCMMHDTLFD